MPRTRDFFYIFITCIIAIIFLAIAPSPALTPHGVFLPAPKNMLPKPVSQLKPILPKDVRISTFAPNTLPIGTISIVRHAESLSKQAMQKNALSIARSKAREFVKSEYKDELMAKAEVVGLNKLITAQEGQPGIEDEKEQLITAEDSLKKLLKNKEENTK